MKDTFIFYRSFAEAMEDMTDKQQLSFLKAIIKYALYGAETELKGIEKMAFTLVKPQLEACANKYEASKKCAEYGKLGAEYGKLGGRPKKGTPVGVTEKTPRGVIEETPIGVTEKTPPLNPPDNPLYVNVNVNDNYNLKKIDRSKRETAEESTVKDQELESSVRGTSLSAFLQAYPSIEVDITSMAPLYGKDFDLVSKRFEKSEYLRSEADSLSWICKFYDKIISGAYDGKGKRGAKPGGEKGEAEEAIRPKKRVIGYRTDPRVTGETL